jgi:hypothetical protein
MQAHIRPSQQVHDRCCFGVYIFPIGFMLVDDDDAAVVDDDATADVDDIVGFGV